VPVSVPVIPPVVMVRVTGTLPEVRVNTEAVALKVPLATNPPEKVTVPVAETLPLLVDPVPLIVTVVLTVVEACAPTPSKENNVSPQRIVLDPLVAARCNCLRMFNPTESP